MTDTAEAYEAGLNVVRGHFGARPPDQPPLQGGGGGGRFDGMDPWQQTVETRLGEIRGDIRQLLQFGIAAAALLLAAFAAGYVLLSGEVGNKADQIGTKIDTLSDRIGQLGERVARFEGSQPQNKD